MSPNPKPYDNLVSTTKEVIPKQRAQTHINRKENSKASEGTYGHDGRHACPYTQTTAQKSVELAG